MGHAGRVLWLGPLVMLFAVVTLIEAADTSLRAQASAVFTPLPRDVATPEHPLTPERVHLGRLLFFDPRISVDGTVSCARCHQPTLYGTDALPRSIGAEHRTHPRHAQTVVNAAVQFVQHWRGDRTSVEDQAVRSLTAPLAYGNPSFASAMAKIKAIPGYAPLFAGAFPREEDPITPDNWGKAIGAYVRTLLTPAPFDAFLQGDDRALTTAAQTGLRTFIQTGCATCHNGVGVGGTMYRARNGKRRCRQGTVRRHAGPRRPLRLQGREPSQRGDDPTLLPRRLGGDPARGGPHHGARPAWPHADRQRGDGDRGVPRVVDRPVAGQLRHSADLAARRRREPTDSLGVGAASARAVRGQCRWRWWRFG